MRFNSLITSHGRHAAAAVTRTEVLFIVGAVALVALVGFQFRTKLPTKQARCTQNMKDIVLGYTVWIYDHEDRRPPWAVKAADSGNLGLDPGLTRQSWFQFSWISNELRSPKALADPADKRKGLRVANSWGSDPNGGLSSQGFRNNACSYALGIDISVAGPPRHSPFDIWSIPVVLLDRHVSNNGRTDKCWFATNLTTLNEPFNVRWRNDGHGKRGGNLGLLGGQVTYVTSPQLIDRFYSNIDYPARGNPRATVYEAHFLFPD